MTENFPKLMRQNHRFKKLREKQPGYIIPLAPLSLSNTYTHTYISYSDYWKEKSKSKSQRHPEKKETLHIKNKDRNFAVADFSSESMGA